MPINPTVITAQLDDKELRKSIDELVEYVGGKTQDMADNFNTSMTSMKESMKNFALTQKVSVDLMKESWKDMSRAFDVMYKAQDLKMNEKGEVSNEPTTVNEMRSLISYHEALVGKMQLESGELKQGVEQLASEKAYLKENLSTEEQITRELEKQESLQKRRERKQLQEAQAPFMNDYKMALRQSDVYLDGARKKMKELGDIQERMRKSGLFNEAQLREVEKRMDSLREKIKRLQKSSPKTLKQVLGMDENSIEAISLKLSALRKIKVGSHQEIKALSDEYQRLGELQAKMMGRAFQYANANNVLARSFNYIRNRIIYALSVTALTQFGRSLYEIRAQYELLERSLGVLVNSFENGSKIFRELSDMALKSPFTLVELGTAAKQLTAYNFAAKEVVSTTKRLADISAALGVPMERLTYNLGQIRAQTVLTSRDARDFANAGLPIVKSLADYYTELEGRVVSTGDVFDRLKDKAVSYNDVMAVLTKMTDEGGKFFDFQAKQAETLKVQLANLNLAWNNFLNDLGKMNQSALSLPLKGIRTMLQNWKEINKVITTLIIAYGAVKAKQLVFNALLGKGTQEAIRQANALKADTQQKYKNVLITKNLSNEQAMLLLSLNRTNVTLKKAMVNMKLLNADQAQAIVSCNKWRLSLMQLQIVGKMAFTGMLTSIKSITMLLKSNAWLIAISAIIDLFMTWKSNADAVKQVNDDLVNSAKEAAKAMGDYLKAASKSHTISKVVNNKMSQEELEKTWASLREQIEQSSSASDVFINELLKVEDLSKRVGRGFGIAFEIEHANNKLKDFNKELKITETGAWYGFWGGEGLVDDLNDAVKAQEKYLNAYKDNNEYYTILYRNEWNKQLGELKKEVDVTANSIINILEKNKIKGEYAVREAIERIKNTIIESKQLSGAAATTFSYVFDQLMGEKLDNVEYKTTTVWNTILDHIKNETGSAFISLTDEILEEEAKWSKEQEDAIRKAVNEAKNELPDDAKEIFDKIQEDFNSREWKIKITTQYDTQEIDKLQNAFDKAFPKMGVWAGLRPEAGSTFVEYGDRVNKTIKSTGESITTLTKQLEEARESEKAGSKELVSGLENELQKNKDINEAAKKIKDTWKIQEKEKNTNGSNRDFILDTLKEEISLIEKLQGDYEKLTKAGATSEEALSSVRSAYGNTIDQINDKLDVFGLSRLDLSMIRGRSPQEQLDYFKKIKDELKRTGLGTLDRMKTVEGVIEKLDVKVKEYNLDMVTKGLNNELEKLKEEYSLGIEFDASPELGDVFADMIGIDKDELSKLPRTYSQVARKAQDAINKVFSKNKIANPIDITQTLNKEDFDAWIEMRGNELESGLAKSLNNIREYLNKVRQDETKQTINNWSQLVEKYGNVQSKVLKIYKESVKEQYNIIRRFGDKEDEREAFNLMEKINLSSSPSDIARLQKELAEIINKVTKGNMNAISINAAIEKGMEKSSAKAYWEDFKDSDEYADMFDKLSFLSVSALQRILNKMDEVKGKIQEDPASLKAWMEQYNKVRDAIYEIDPSKELGEGMKSFIQGIKELSTSSNAIKATEKYLESLKKQLSDAESELQTSLRALDDADTTGDRVAQENLLVNITEQKKKIKELNEKIKEQEDEITSKTKTQNAAREKIEKGLGDIRGATEKWANQFQTLSNAMSAIANVFSALGDDETAEQINDMNKGFQIMITMLTAVNAVVIAIQFSMGALYVIAMAVVGLFVGLISLFEGNYNRAINRKIEESEARVRKLELAYKDLEKAIEDAYGAEKYAVTELEIANKKAQLAELKRQYELERSRKGKHYDQEKVDEYASKVKDLENEIDTTVKSITKDLLGISSVGDAAENLVDSMIEAFRNGEDYMLSYEESFEKMINNMIVKAIASRVIGDRLQEIFDEIDRRRSERGQSERARIEKLYEEKSKIQAQLDEDENDYLYFKNLSYGDWGGKIGKLKDKIDKAKKRLSEISIEEEQAAKRLEEALQTRPEDIDYVRNQREALKDSVMNDFKALMDAVGVTWGENGESNLSALQQGIQGITEDTAGAIEAYMNGVSQQVYLHSDLLTQIRDTISNWNIDISLATQAQILMQLQASYQVQMSIQNTLQGWSNANGMAMRVEIV